MEEEMIESSKENKNLKYIKKYAGPTLKTVMQKVRHNKENITELDFSKLSSKNRKLEIQGGMLLARVMCTNNTVKKLIIKDHNIKNRGAVAIANMLRVNTTLEYLDLYSNEITDSGIKAISAALYGHESLTHLSLWSNRISDSGAEHLAQALRANDTLTYLGLVHNKITKDGAQALLEGLRDNSTLQTLNLASNRIPASLTRQIRVAIGENRMKYVTKKINDNGSTVHDVNIDSVNSDADEDDSDESGFESCSSIDEYELEDLIARPEDIITFDNPGFSGILKRNISNEWL